MKSLLRMRKSVIGCRCLPIAKSYKHLEVQSVLRQIRKANVKTYYSLRPLCSNKEQKGEDKEQISYNVLQSKNIKNEVNLSTNALKNTSY